MDYIPYSILRTSKLQKMGERRVRSRVLWRPTWALPNSKRTYHFEGSCTQDDSILGSISGSMYGNCHIA